MDSIDVAGNLLRVRARMADAADRAGRAANSIGLVAVSKTKPEAMIRAAYAAGQRQFGENYVQEGVDKVRALDALDIEWHFIGPLQSNKTRLVAEHFSWVHGIDREKIVRRLSEQRPDHLPDLNVCLQVNISGEPNKSGLHPNDVAALALVCVGLPRVKLRGLMAIPEASDDIAAQRRPFARMRELLASINDQVPALDTLSMGMSGDLEAAVLEGATLVRIGTDIFGARG